MKRSPIPSSAVLGSLAGLGSGSALASGALPVPNDVAWWVPYAMTIIMTIGPLVVGAIVRAVDARNEALARADMAKARQLRDDNDPSNDHKIEKLEDSAANRRANAAAIRAFGKTKHNDPES